MFFDFCDYFFLYYFKVSLLIMNQYMHLFGIDGDRQKGFGFLEFLN